MGNWIDNLIGYVNPVAGIRREAARNLLQARSSYAGGVAGVGATGYGGASTTRLDTPWGFGSQAASQLAPVAWQLNSMRERARSLERNNVIAKGILDRDTNNVVGDGFTLQIESGDSDWDKQAEELFNDWTDVADISGLTWSQHQRLVYRSYRRDGDVGVVLVGDPNVEAYARLQALEGDLIGAPEKQDKTTIDGITYDEYLAPTTYWVKRIENLTGTYKSVPIDAKDFVLLANRTRLRQLRGEPCFASAFQLFDQVDQYIDATIVAGRIAACMSIFVEKENPQNVVGTFGTVTNAEGNQQRALNIEPGMVNFLRTGEKVSTVNPSQPSQNFSDTLKTFLRLVGSSMGLPLELVLNDFETGSYAAARAALMTAYLEFDLQRKLFTDVYLSRLYRWRISKFINDGKLADVPGKFRHRWVGTPYPYLDPVKEAQAVQIRCDVGLETIKGAQAAIGKEFDGWLNQRAIELKAMRDKSVPVYHHSASVPEQETADVTTGGGNGGNDD